MWIICLLLHLSENNVKITQFSLYLGVLFTWQDSHYQYQYGCSTNKSQMGLKSFVFNLSCSKCVRVHFIYVRSRILKRGTYEALRQSSLFVKTFVNWGAGCKISLSVQPVDLHVYYYSFSFNRVVLISNIFNK